MVLPLLTMVLVEPALPEPEDERSQRSVCPAPAVKLTPAAPLPTMSTIQELDTGTKRVVETLLLDAEPPEVADDGAACATPLSDTEPAVALTTAPAKLTRT